MKPALLVIDMQNDFVKEGALFEIKGIRRNIQDFRNFIDTCRDKGVLIIHTRHCYSPETNPVEAKLFPKLAEEGLRKGTEGWEIYDELKPHEDDIVLDKTRYDAFFKTNLKEILDSNNIDTVIITGTMTNVCCESTARTAMYHDYDVIFCSDMTYCSVEEIQNNTLKVMKYFGKAMSSEEIIKIL
jgi:ureidoacrylate peracid hydrolase